MTQDSPPPLRVVHSLPPADASADYQDDWMAREAVRQRLRAEAAEARADRAEAQLANAMQILTRLRVLTQAMLTALSAAPKSNGPGDVW